MEDLDRDFLSDLPQSIIETILTKLPIRDAVRTSILSNRWRYKWASMTHLVFDDRSATQFNDRMVVEDRIVNFITRFLFLHDGPIHKFSLSSSFLQSSPDIDQWLLFISRKDVKELILELGEGEWFRAPSCVFSCKNLMRLELVRCELDPPPNFKGFLCLKYLNLQQVLIPPDDIECLISSCPLLESLTLSYFDSLELTVRAPNLKYLILEGEFKDLCLANTPLLIAISVAMYMTDDIAEHFEQSSSCNFDKFLGGVPELERLIGHIYFTKLIVNSPNLKALQISGSSNTSAATQAPDLQFWDEKFSTDCMLRQLKTVKLTDVSGVPHEMKFIKFLLEHSPSLEEMSITPSLYVTEGRLNMLIDLVCFRRASPQASIVFIHEPA
ncbi:F-box/FBD/LRR-repeat protein At1g13570 isoform X2 [Sesamum indicum]|uniref:F-box/FBD/LRR-repeat protein At1g13570 isoform X2 n=1 Tax=Sesamum indicum TaxID=4182 RepID=A0A6I9T2C3_SESIN|nr:F-box/FBD/LRR-repeat protein At1g13570 isoform X2 [Sesamum indicum]